MRFLLLCLFFPMVTSAQKFDISVSGGVNQTFRFKGNEVYSRAGVKPMPAMSVKAWRTKKHFAYGVKVSAMGSEGYVYNGAKRTSEIYAAPMLGVDFMIGNKADFGKSRTIVGWQVGGVTNMRPRRQLDYWTTTTYREGYGISTGPIITYTYYISKIGIGMEFSPKLNILSDVTLITAPVLIGAHLKL